MANRKQNELVLQLSIDQDKAEAQMKQMKGKMRDIFKQMSDEANKMTYFKDAVDYLRQIDVALTDLRKKHGAAAVDAIYGGFGKQLRDELSKSFDLDGINLSQFGALRQQLQLAKSQDSKKELREAKRLMSGLTQALQMSDITKEISDNASVTSQVDWLSRELDKIVKKFDLSKQIMSVGFNMSPYDELSNKINELADARKKYIEAEEAEDYDIADYWSERVEKLKEYIIRLGKTEKEIMDIRKKIREDYSNTFNSSATFDSAKLLDDLSQILNITQTIQSTNISFSQTENSGRSPLKSYQELLSIVEQLVSLSKGQKDVDMNHAQVKLLLDDLKNLYATTEQFDKVDSIVKKIVGDQLDTQKAITPLLELFGVELPESIKLSSKRYEDFMEQVNKKKNATVHDADYGEAEAGAHLNDVTAQINALRELYAQGRITEQMMNDAQSEFDKFKQRTETLIGAHKKLNEIRQKTANYAGKADSEINVDSFKAAIEARKRLIEQAKKDKTLSTDVLKSEERHTAELEKRIELMEAAKKAAATTDGAESGGVADGDSNANPSSSTGGSSSGQPAGAATVIGREVDESKEKIAKLKLVSDEYQSIIDAFDKRKKPKMDVTDKNDVDALNASMAKLGDTLVAFATTKEGTDEWIEVYGKLISAIREYQGVIDFVNKSGSQQAKDLLVTPDFVSTTAQANTLLENVEPAQSKKNKEYFEKKKKSIDQEMENLVVGDIAKPSTGAGGAITGIGDAAEDAKNKVVSLSNAFADCVSAIRNDSNIKWTKSIEKHYVKVLEGIKNGTFTTVEQCVSEFKKLANITEVVGGSKKKSGAKAKTGDGQGTGTTGAGTGLGAGTGNADTSALQGHITNETTRIVNKLGETLKVEVVKDEAQQEQQPTTEEPPKPVEIDTTQLNSAISELKTEVRGNTIKLGELTTAVNGLTDVMKPEDKAAATNQAEVDTMKQNLTQLLSKVTQFNNQTDVHGKPQRQEMSAQFMSDGRISTVYGEQGSVPWNRLLAQLINNLNSSLIMDLHSHPLHFDERYGYKYANDHFSGSNGDLAAWQLSKSLGAQLTGMITGNILRTFNVSALSPEKYAEFIENLKKKEQEYADDETNGQYVGRDEKGSVYYKYQPSIEGRHAVTLMFERLMQDALKQTGFTDDQIYDEIFKQYDLTDDRQLTQLATVLVNLNNAAQTSISPVSRLADILSGLGVDTATSDVGSALLGFEKGELSAADVINKLAPGFNVTDALVDAVKTIDATKQPTLVETTLDNILNVLTTISKSLTSIYASVKPNTGDKLTSAIGDVLNAANGINLDNTAFGVQSIYDSDDVSAYRVEDVLKTAKDAVGEAISKVFFNLGEDLNVSDINDMMASFRTALLYVEDAEKQAARFKQVNGEDVRTTINGQDQLATRFVTDLKKTLLDTGSVIDPLLAMLGDVRQKIQSEESKHGIGAEKAAAYERMSYAHSGVFGDEAIAADKAKKNGDRQVGEAVDEKTAAFNKEKEVVDAVVSEEVRQLEILRQKVEEVKGAVEAKTEAFNDEYLLVDGLVPAEVEALNGLLDVLKEITTQIGLIDSGLAKINDLKTGAQDKDKDADNSDATKTDIASATQAISGWIEKLDGFSQKLGDATKAANDNAVALTNISDAVNTKITDLNGLIEKLVNVHNVVSTIGASAGHSDDGSVEDTIRSGGSVALPDTLGDTQADRIAAIRKEADAAEARAISLGKEVQTELSKFGKDKNLAKQILKIGPEEVLEAYRAHKNNRDNYNYTLQNATTLHSSNRTGVDVSKALLQIARFPEKYGGIVSREQATDHFGAGARVASNAIIPLGNGLNIAFGIDKNLVKDGYTGHYNMADKAGLATFDNNGKNIYNSERYISFADMGDSTHDLFGLTIEEMLELPTIQKAMSDFDKQFSKDYNISKILSEYEHRIPSIIKDIAPLFEKYSAFVSEGQNAVNLRNEEKSLQQEMAVREQVGQPDAPINEPVHENQATQNAEAINKQNQVVQESIVTQEKLNSSMEDMPNQVPQLEETTKAIRNQEDAIHDLDAAEEQLQGVINKQEQGIMQDALHMDSVSPSHSAPTISVEMGEVAYALNKAEEERKLAEQRELEEARRKEAEERAKEAERKAEEERKRAEEAEAEAKRIADEEAKRKAEKEKIRKAKAKESLDDIDKNAKNTNDVEALNLLLEHRQKIVAEMKKAGWLDDQALAKQDELTAKLQTKIEQQERENKLAELRVQLEKELANIDSKIAKTNDLSKLEKALIDRKDRVDRAEADGLLSGKSLESERRNIAAIEARVAARKKEIQAAEEQKRLEKEAARIEKERKAKQKSLDAIDKKAKSTKNVDSLKRMLRDRQAIIGSMKETNLLDEEGLRLQDEATDRLAEKITLLEKANAKAQFDKDIAKADKGIKKNDLSTLEAVVATRKEIIQKAEEAGVLDEDALAAAKKMTQEMENRIAAEKQVIAATEARKKAEEEALKLQAEQKKLAQEAAAAEKKAREEVEAAQKAKKEAAKQEAARQEAEKARLEAEKQAAKLAEEKKLADEKAAKEAAEAAKKEEERIRAKEELAKKLAEEAAQKEKEEAEARKKAEEEQRLADQKAAEERAAAEAKQARLLAEKQAEEQKRLAEAQRKEEAAAAMSDNHTSQPATDNHPTQELKQVETALDNLGDTAAETAKQVEGTKKKEAELQKKKEDGAEPSDDAKPKEQKKQKSKKKTSKKSPDKVTGDKVYSSEDTYKKALEYAMKLTAEGKKATVQMQDSGRYTVSYVEEINGLSRKVFQTFDETCDQIERTTVTVSNNMVSAMADVNKTIQQESSKVGNDGLLKQYNDEYTKLIEMNAKYSAMDDLSQEDVDGWSQQIALVQQLGGEVSKLIQQREKLDLSASNKKLDAYLGEANSAFKGLDINATDGDQKAIADQYTNITGIIDNLKKTKKAATEEELRNIAELVDALKKQANAYKEANGWSDVRTKNFGATATRREDTRHNKLSEYGARGYFKSSKFSSMFTTYDAEYNRLIEKQKTLSSQDVITKEQLAEFDILKSKVVDFGKELERMIKTSEKLKDGAWDTYDLDSDFDDTRDGRERALTDYINGLSDFEVQSIKFKNNWQECVAVVKDSDGTFKQVTATIDQFGNRIVSNIDDAGDAVNNLGQFIDLVKVKFGQIFAYLTASFGIEEFFQQIRQGIEYVREIDNALTELKKVTNETDAEYEHFLQNMSKTAGVVGSTVAELTKSAADWARLGYSMNEAGKLAATTAKLLNVSEFESVDDATSALVSSLQAFKEDGQDASKRAEEIVDILNNIGNKYPVATNELADGLATSGAALVAANNSIEEQVALLAAGNATMQDISAVSSGLKIVAARLRGTTSEADDDAESAVTNVSKLQEKIKDLTAEANGGEGIDIINEDGSYKSTWEILTEISKIFDKMDDMSQASLLELIAGKNRSSVVAAVLQNGEILEKAYTDALDSKGSAQEELDTYLNSIQGKIDKFTNTLQTMWMNTISSDTIKMFVDLGTAAIGAVDKIGMLPTVMMGVIGYFSLFKKISPIGIFKDLGSMISGYSSAIQQLNTLSKSGFDTQTITAYAQAVSGLSAKKQALALAGAGLNKQQIQEILTRNQVNKATIDQIMSEGELAAAKNLTTTAIVSEAVVLSAEEKAKLSETAQNWLAANSSKQLTLDLLQEAVAHDVLTKEAAEEIAVKNNLIATNTQAATTSASLWKTFSSMPLLGKIGLVVAAVGAVYTVFKKVYDLVNPSTEQLVQEWEEAKSEIENVNSELQATKSRIEELESKGVLSIVDKQELVQLRQTSDELERRLRLAKQNEASAANKAKRAVEKEYKEYVVTMSAGDVTEETMKQYNDSDIITRLLPTFQDNSSSLPALNGFDRFTEYQQGVIQSALSAEAFAELSTKPWVDVSDTIKEEVYSVVATHQQAMEDISYASVGGAKDVHIEEYIDEATKKIQELKSKIYNSNGQLKPGITDEYAIEIHNQIKEIESELIAASGELYEYMDQYGADSTDAFVRGLQDQINKIDMVINPIEFYAKKFDEILGKYSDEKKTLYELAEAGQLSADALNNTTYAPLMSELNKLGITAQDVVDHITSLGEVELAKVTDPTFSIADYVTGIDDIQEKISSLQGALESLESGTFTYSDFIDLTQQFPELAKGVDTSSKSFNGLAKNLRKAIKAAPDELVDELKDLRKQLKENGRSTVEIDQLIDAMENLPVDAVKNLSDEYVTLSDKIKEAKTAQNELQEAMSENPNEGYETRGEAMEYMKDKMKRGEIGSESELWDVAEQYGFTYDSAKSINENADALAQFIAIREQWFAKNDDGEYTFAGTEDFINDVEKVVNSNAELQKILKWEYDENTGVFNFDFDNANWDQIIAYLSESKELAGLTSEEFHDMLVQIGQYFGLNWEDANDITKYIDEIYKSSADSTTKLEEMTSAIEPYVEKELKMDIDFDSLTYADIAALNCEESIKRLLGVYVENRDYLKSNPLQIKYNGDIETDIINPLKNAGLEIVETVDEANNKQFTFDVIDLETLMRDKGYTTENIMGVVNRIFGEGSNQSKLIGFRDAFREVEYVSDNLVDTLKELGVEYNLIESTQGAHLFIDGNIEEVLRDLQFTDQEIEAFKTKWSENGIYVNTIADTSGAEEAKEAADGQPESVTTVLNADVTQFNEDIKTAISNVEELAKSRTATIVLNTVTRKVSIPSGTAAGAAVGTNVNGTAHAQGSWGAKESGTSLGGELGPEILVRDGRWQTIGENGAEFFNIKKGDIIFNH